MSEARVIACNNCGSRYKLPPTFQGSKVRCKKCSAAIEIESSIVSAEAPATPAPAKAPAKAKARNRPAEPAKKAEKAEAKRPASARRGRGSKVSGSRSSRGRRSAAAEEEDDAEEKSSRRGSRGGSRSSSRRQSREGARGRRGRGGEDEVEAKSKTPMVLGIGGGVALLAVALFFLLGGKNDPNTTNAGQGEKVAKTSTDKGSEKAIPELPPEEGSTEEGSKVAESGEPSGDGASGDGASGEKAGKAEEASTKSKGKTKEAAAKKKKTAKKTPKKKAIPGERSTPFDAMTQTEEVAWTEDTTDEEKKIITDLVETTFADSALAGMRAGKAVAKYGRKAFPAILNRLRSVDYMDPDQHLQAYGLHEILKAITLGRNAGYNPKKPVTQGAAWWNAMTVKSWIRFWTSQVGEGDPAAWKKFIDLRKKKQKAEEEDDDF